MATAPTLFTDAMGLSIDRESILAAVGNEAFLRAGTSCVRLPQRMQMQHKKVHGLALSHACSLRRLLLIYCETRDWINAATFLKQGDGCELVIHMSHSALLHLRYDDGECRILELACSTEYSMLYHTSLNGFQYNKLMIISGNGFGEILIWQPRHPVAFNPVTFTKTYPLRLRLKAHNGVIFSIDFNLRAQLLVTTSDDRSLKFWQLNSIPTADWKLCAAAPLRPMFSCFGHSSRVICAIIVMFDGQVFVISGGEDSYICLWSQSGDMLFKRRQQFGAPIWRLGYDSSTFTLYSTSSTGNILAYNLHTALRKNAMNLTSLTTIPMNSTSEFVKNIKYLNTSTIIGLSSKNRLLYMKVSRSSQMDVWKLVIAFPAYKCTVLSVYDRIVATCGYQRVTLLGYNTETDIDTEHFQILYDGIMLEGLIKSFHFLNKDTYLISDEFGNCLILKGLTMEIQASIKISNCREPWITAALLVSPTYLLLSCRNGHTMLYSKNASNHFDLKDTLKCLHGNMGSNMFKFVLSNDNYAYVLSAGHESILKHLRISYTDCRLTIMRRECVPLSWVEASPTFDVLIGFNDNHLVVWSRQHDVLLELQCGGAHRCWDFQLNCNELHIIYVKQKQVFFYSQLLYNNCPERFVSTLQSSWHTRNCNIIQLIQHQNENQSSYMISAGDDNIIKINQLSGHSIIQFQLAELHTHISSVRHLILYPIKSEILPDLWLIFSVGGRAQLCINQIDLKGPVISELCSHTIQSNSASKTISHNARLMAIQVVQHSEIEFGRFSLYLGSADGKIRLLSWRLENPSEVHLQRQIDIDRCPLHLQFLNNNNLLLISTTHGMLYGFDHTLSFKRFQLQLHTTGINALHAVVNDHLLHVLSGGDDENVKHTIIHLTDMTIQHSTAFQDLHNAQVNALTLYPYRGVDQTFEICAYTCSIDKQIFKVNLTTKQYTRIGFTCISDVKGLLLYNNKYLYIYGSGLHVMAL
ncbi:WD repeat-containing protein 6 isoform X2 [Drosophila innubila]|uniref:WD repeat-containing protein 6 isoform X2 n=1 Tax=Drosophila innubila TaxID=198719 RepID=UPI00148D25A7|nr:WD repeat-containing protein 6 isoform X2 [Drosophila innubila]